MGRGRALKWGILAVKAVSVSARHESGVGRREE